MKLSKSVFKALSLGIAISFSVESSAQQVDIEKKENETQTGQIGQDSVILKSLNSPSPAASTTNPPPKSAAPKRRKAPCPACGMG